MINIHQLVTMQCRVVKPIVLAFMWMPPSAYIIAGKVQPVTVTSLTSGSAPWHATKTDKEWPQENMSKSLRHQPALHNPQFPIQLNIWRTCQSQSDPWQPQLITHWTLVPDTTGHSRKVLRPCVNGSETSLSHSGASTDWSCSGKCHRCLIWLWGGGPGLHQCLGGCCMSRESTWMPRLKFS